MAYTILQLFKHNFRLVLCSNRQLKQISSLFVNKSKAELFARLLICLAPLFILCFIIILLHIGVCSVWYGWVLHLTLVHCFCILLFLIFILTHNYSPFFVCNISLHFFLKIYLQIVNFVLRYSKIILGVIYGAFRHT